MVSSRREEFDVDARGRRISNTAQGKRPPAIFDNESICVLEVRAAERGGGVLEWVVWRQHLRAYPYVFPADVSTVCFPNHTY